MSTASRTISPRRRFALNLGRLLVLSSVVTVVVVAGADSAGAVTSSFRTPYDYPTGNYPNSVAVADFDGDGHLDNVSTGNHISVVFGSSNGDVDDEVRYHLDDHMESVGVGDFDADGHPDVVVSHPYANTVSVLLGSPDGTLGDPTSFEAGMGPTSVIVGDVNGDGDPDLVATNGDYEGVVRAGTVSILLGGPGGTFGAPTAFPAGVYPTSVAIGDFDGDSVPDLVVGTSDANGGGLLWVLLGNGDGTFEQGGSQPLPNNREYPGSIAVGDFNGDADPDLAVVVQSVGVRVLLGAAGGTFTLTGSYDVGAPYDVAVGDFNSDSHADLVLAGAVVLHGHGDGTFGDFTNFQSRGVPLSVAVGDVNSDNVPDLVVANATSASNPNFGSVAVLVNNTDTTPPETTITGGPAGDPTQDTPTFTFTSSEPGSTFMCRRDAAEPFQACTSPWQVPAGLGDGPHTFEVHATDAAGNEDPTPASRTYVVDTVSPMATFTAGTFGPTNDATPTFAFTADEPGSTFRCQVDDAAFADCDSPFTTPELADGEHTVRVLAIDPAGNFSLAWAAVRTFSVDTVAPGTSITGGPETVSTDTTPTFTFTSPEPDATFQCTYDDGLFSPCSSPYTPTAVGDGTFTFRVRAKDAAGNVDPTPATWTFTVDRSVPGTAITTPPFLVTADNTPTFEFTSTKPGSTFECRVDDGAVETCTSPHTMAQLDDGSHSFEVRAKDSAGNVDPEWRLRVFTVDTVAPDTTITGGPTGLTNDSTPTFSWPDLDDAVAHECRVDNNPFTACSSPHTLDPVGGGPHTFEVRAIDGAGNVDPTPAQRAFKVDIRASVTSITAGPSGVTDDPTPTFAFVNPEIGSFECRVAPGSFTPCTSPYTVDPLPDGQHTFEVRSIDLAGNVEDPAIARTFTVDATAPDTTITGGPTGPTNDRTPTFSWPDLDDAVAHECRVDDQPFTECESPHTTVTLDDGDHTFEVRAIDGGGNVDPTPAERSFTVDTNAPDTTITSGPTGTIHHRTPTFELDSSDPRATLECRIDNGPFEPCTSPYTTTPLNNGQHTFEARATDAAGNTDPTPATRTFTVTLDATAPETTITQAPALLSLLSSKAKLVFTSSEEDSLFECRLDGGAWTACTSPQVYTGLRAGNHSFAVRATDPAGNTDPTPATATWCTLGLLPF